MTTFLVNMQPIGWRPATFFAKATISRKKFYEELSWRIRAGKPWWWSPFLIKLQE